MYDQEVVRQTAAWPVTGVTSRAEGELEPAQRSSPLVLMYDGRLGAALLYHVRGCLACSRRTSYGVI